MQAASPTTIPRTSHAGEPAAIDVAAARRTLRRSWIFPGIVLAQQGQVAMGWALALATLMVVPVTLLGGLTATAFLPIVWIGTQGVTLSWLRRHLGVVRPPFLTGRELVGLLVPGWDLARRGQVALALAVFGLAATTVYVVGFVAPSLWLWLLVPWLLSTYFAEWFQLFDRTVGSAARRA